MSKRPRAETSVSAQPSTRVRVEEPETTFTLFDDADLKELELSIFDGQLSECSTLSDESTLTFDSSDNSEYEVEEPLFYPTRFRLRGKEDQDSHLRCG